MSTACYTTDFKIQCTCIFNGISSCHETVHYAKPVCIWTPCLDSAKRIRLALENPRWCAVARHCSTGRRLGDSAVLHSDQPGSLLFVGRDGAVRGGDRL